MTSEARTQIFNQEELEAEIKRHKEQDEYTEAVLFNKSKHSLDSDEEDEDEKISKYNVLDPNELEGQEDRTIDFDGEIKIMPFNMKEELEEGYFDKDGTYIFKKETDVIKDQWLDDIDWIKVKATESTKRELKDEDDSDEDLPQVNVFEHYTKMLPLMKPKETVQKAICRLGGSKSASRSASNKWKKKKEDSKISNSEENDENQEKLQLLTTLANDIIQSGDMDVYQQSYEKLQFYINSRNKAGNSKPDREEISDSALDMFGDEFDEKLDETKTPVQQSSSANTEIIDPDSEVMWEFKWENTDDAKVYGPYPTTQMLQWVQEKYFEDGVFVRQAGKQDSSFSSSKRMDFELYL